MQRWGSWLEAAIYYAEYFHEVKEIIENLDDEGILVRKAKEAVKSENVIQQLVERSSYRDLIALVKKIESNQMTIAAAHQSLVATKNKISDVDSVGLVQYINGRLDQATDLQEIIEANGYLQ